MQVNLLPATFSSNNPVVRPVFQGWEKVRSQSCPLGAAKFHCGNHVVQSLRAYFILYVITMKFIKCVEEKIEFSCMLQRPRLISTEIVGHVSMATKIKQQ